MVSVQHNTQNNAAHAWLMQQLQAAESATISFCQCVDMSQTAAAGVNVCLCGLSVQNNTQKEKLWLAFVLLSFNSSER